MQLFERWRVTVRFSRDCGSRRQSITIRHGLAIEWVFSGLGFELRTKHMPSFQIGVELGRLIRKVFRKFRTARALPRSRCGRCSDSYSFLDLIYWSFIINAGSLRFVGFLEAGPFENWRRGRRGSRSFPEALRVLFSLKFQSITILLPIKFDTSNFR